VVQMIPSARPRTLRIESLLKTFSCAECQPEPFGRKPMVGGHFETRKFTTTAQEGSHESHWTRPHSQSEHVSDICTGSWQAAEKQSWNSKDRHPEPDISLSF
jgi:hypothetical protein